MGADLVSGYFRLRKGARIYQVRYVRTQEQDVGYISGTRLRALAVYMEGELIMRFERGEWLMLPATPEDRAILDEIRERIK